MEKLFEEIIAPDGKRLKSVVDGEVVYTDRVTAPLGTDLSAWEVVDK